ncbi:MAG: DUF4235 domain-containing protein [Candidatus Nanopelagicales bacterium]|jgi:hypothetical protein
MDASDDATPVSGDAVAEVETEINPVMHLVAPIAAVFVTMIVRSAVNKAYEKATGRPAPEARDPRTSIVRALAWTTVITTTAAVAEVLVYRTVNKLGSKPHQA